MLKKFKSVTGKRTDVYTGGMNRRTDEKTAERINLALLTRAAFDTHTAVRFARISGLATTLVEGVFARDLHKVRQQVSYFGPKSDRRKNPRDDGAA